MSLTCRPSVADIGTLRRSARSRHSPTSSAFSTSTIRCTMPLGVSPGMNARLWWRGLTPKNRSQAGRAVGGPCRPAAVAAASSRADRSRARRGRSAATPRRRGWSAPRGRGPARSVTNLWPYGLTTRRCSSATPWKTSRRVARRIVEADHLVDAAVGEFGLPWPPCTGVPSRSRRLRISCSPAAFAVSQPESSSRSCSPGTITSRAGNSSIRR